MRYTKLSSAVLMLTLILTSCKKDKGNQPPGNNPSSYKYLLKTIEWDNGTKATLYYNTDSTIKKIGYVNQSLGDAVDYAWSAKRVINMSYASSLYTNTLNYNNDKLISVVNTYKDLSLPNGYKFEYAYNVNGTLKELKYYTINEAGTKLITTTTYDYNASGDPQTITTTQVNNIKIVYTIDSWSQQCEFNPWVFVSASLSEYYQLYNYPVLSKLKKLPGKLTKTIKEPGMPDKVDRITDNVYTITNQRLDKTVTTLSYPGHPELDQTQTAVYNY
jgi:hypothetical protein